MADLFVVVAGKNDKVAVGGRTITLPPGRYTSDDMTEIVAGEIAKIRVEVQGALPDRDGHEFVRRDGAGCAICDLPPDEHWSERARAKAAAEPPRATTATLWFHGKDAPKPLTEEELDAIASAADACGDGPSLKAIARNGKIAFEEDPILAGGSDVDDAREFSFVMLRPDAARRLVAEVRRLRNKAWDLRRWYQGNAGAVERGEVGLAIVEIITAEMTGDASTSGPLFANGQQEPQD